MAGTTRSILMACLTAVAIAGQPLMAQEDDVVERSF